MAVSQSDITVPTWAAVVLVGLIGVSFAVGIGVAGSITAPIAFWGSLLSIVLSLLVVYLFYRLVIAVETIATKL